MGVLLSCCCSIGIVAAVVSGEEYFFESRSAGLHLPVPQPVPRGEYLVPKATIETIKSVAAPIFVGNWTKAEASSALVRFGWNEQGLIIHAEVFDDAVSPSTNPNRLWEGDGMEIYLDLRQPSDRSREYMNADRAGQLILAPPAVADAPLPQICKGAGSLAALFALADLERGYVRTTGGYELWMIIPEGDWLGSGKEILADVCLNDRGDEAGGQFFAFGGNFNWKETTRFGILTFGDASSTQVFMQATASLGIAGRQGTDTIFERVTCTGFSTNDLSAAELSPNDPAQFEDSTTSLERKALGDAAIYKKTFHGRNIGREDITFTMVTGEQRATLGFPSNIGAYRQMLSAISEADRELPPFHYSHMMTDIARQELLDAMYFKTLGGEELARRIDMHVGIAKDLAAGIDHPRLYLRGYYSSAQGRWIPFTISRTMKQGKASSLDFFLHGSSGFDFSRSAFVGQKLADADNAQRDDWAWPSRPTVYLYGGGNDYAILGAEDWDHVPALAFAMMDVDPNRVHLTGHSLGGGATYSYGATIGDLVPGISFATFTPTSGGMFGQESTGTTPYERYLSDRNNIKILGAFNYQKRPFLLIHGVEDKTVPIEQSRTAKAWLDSIGNPADLLELPAQEHGISGYGEIRDLWLAKTAAKPLRQWMAYFPRLCNLRGLKAEAFLEWGKPGLIRFTDSDSITTENIGVLSIKDYQPETGSLTINGVAADLAQPYFWVDARRAEDIRQTTSLKTRHNSGPMLEFVRRGFVLVTGTRKPGLAETLLALSQRLRDSILRSEWGMKEEWLKIYKDTDPDIPGDMGIIVVGSTEENLYAAQKFNAHAATLAGQIAAIHPTTPIPAYGKIILTPDRHVLIEGTEDFYDTLAGFSRQSLGYDYQIWGKVENRPTPVIEGEFDNLWQVDASLMQWHEDKPAE
jgi:hypothetical protein